MILFGGSKVGHWGHLLLRPRCSPKATFGGVDGAPPPTPCSGGTGLSTGRDGGGRLGDVGRVGALPRLNLCTRNGVNGCGRGGLRIPRGVEGPRGVLSLRKNRGDRGPFGFHRSCVSVAMRCLETRQH